MKRSASISHDEATICELRDDPVFAIEYLNAAAEESAEPQVLLIVMRQLAMLALGEPSTSTDSDP